jgi:hypothetical protein
MGLFINDQVGLAFASQVAGLATTGARVFQDESHPLSEADLPALRVYIKDDQVSDGMDTQSTDTASPFLQRRDLMLTCEALAKSNSGLIATLNQIRKEVELAIAANPRLGGLAKLPCRIKGMPVGVGYNTEIATGQGTMTWLITAFTMSNAPDVAL